MKKSATLVLLLLLFSLRLVVAGEPPQNVQQLWADFDPRKDPLQVEVVREWKDGGGTYRYVRYLIGTFRGKPAYMAAFYGFPEGTKTKLPAVMHMHGGGQRAFLEEVKTYVDRGYAALSVNWGGREMEEARPDDPNTDWGVVDPTQKNVPGYMNLLPGEKFLVDQESPKNCNWYLLTLGCRRGITFLEQQPEVDPKRIGIYGHSMGGNLTMYVAGTDARVKVAAPSVGGQGWRTETHEMSGGSCKQENIRGNTSLFARTLGFESYAPRIHCPVLHLSGTNDFHGWMDDVYRTNALIQGQPLRYAFSPHLNHRFIPEVAVTRPLWLDQFLKGGLALPQTPDSQWQLKTADGTPTLRVIPYQHSLPVARVDIYYSTDPDPRARFWRSAHATKVGISWEAKLPLFDTSLPLFAFANAYHTLPKPESLPHMPETREVCLSSVLHSVTAEELKAAGVAATEHPSALIDDFKNGWRDWYRLEGTNTEHWENWTRKITDPQWQGADGASLEITLTTPDANTLNVVAIENEWRSYRGKKVTYVCRKPLSGSPNPQTITLSASDFQDNEGRALAHWRQLDQLGFCAQYALKDDAKNSPPTKWKGQIPTFHRLAWTASPKPAPVASRTSD
jgi:hypothetical protein